MEEVFLLHSRKRERERGGDQDARNRSDGMRVRVGFEDESAIKGTFCVVFFG